MIEFMNWVAKNGYIRYISNGDVKYYSPNERKFHLGFKAHTKYYSVEELIKKYETDNQVVTK